MTSIGLWLLSNDMLLLECNDEFIISFDSIDSSLIPKSWLSLGALELSNPPLMPVKAVAPINRITFLSKNERLFDLNSKSDSGSASLIPPPVLRNSESTAEAFFLVLHFN